MEILRRLTSRIEQTRALDTHAEKLAAAISPMFSLPGVKDALSGSWLGHPVHPLLVTIPHRLMDRCAFTSIAFEVMQTLSMSRWVS